MIANDTKGEPFVTIREIRSQQSFLSFVGALGA